MWIIGCSEPSCCVSLSTFISFPLPISETYLKLESLVDLKMFLLLEDESGRRRVAGSQRAVDDFFGDGIRFKEGDLEIALDAKKRNIVECRRDANNVRM